MTSQNRPYSRIEARKRQQIQGRRILGVILFAVAVFVTWATNGFHAEKDLSRYPQKQLTYSGCRLEQVSRSRGSTTRQIVLVASDGRYVMEDGVWGKHLDGLVLADTLNGSGTIHVWLHPRYTHVLRGIVGGNVDIPPQWGLEFDQRNMRIGLWITVGLVIASIALWLWRR